ncbi:MAG: formyltransferase family protein [Schleiferiaceae bacterium]|nr:formyltransferase family protein [Schleiferiaceae bacterium]
MLSTQSQPLISLAILASGSGSNAAAIVDFFEGHKSCRIEGIWTNSSKAGVLSRKLSVPVHVFTPEDDDAMVLREWKIRNVQAIACAGYLKRIPNRWIQAFPSRIWNVHPSLLPKFGGAGMYGLHIHRAAILAGEVSSGLSIHEVTAEYDEGALCFQCALPVLSTDDAESLQARILRAEHWAFPRVLEALLLDKNLPDPSACPK